MHYNNYFTDSATLHSLICMSLSLKTLGVYIKIQPIRWVMVLIKLPRHEQ